MKVRFYGKLADLLGNERDVQVDAPCTVEALRIHLARECPEAAGPLAEKRVRACIDDAFVHDGHILSGGEQVELLAPVSGG